MKIAFVMATPVLSPSNGVRMQALTWQDALENLGHEVTLINPFKPYVWTDFDVIHFFSFNDYMLDFVRFLSPINPNIIVSPILDPNHSLLSYKIISRWGSDKFLSHNRFNNLRKSNKYVKAYSARSEYEKLFLAHGIGIPENKIIKNPLSYRFAPSDTCSSKEKFCLHVSLLADERKNVARIIAAAKKYNFNLILGGKLRNEKEKLWLESQINGDKMIEYAGFLNDNDLTSLYKKAKVFALPSIYEGVGLVALDAAVFQCNIIITNSGGPQEYYDNLAWTVNPYSVDDIGASIIQAMNDESDRPKLVAEHVIKNYSKENTVSMLVKDYEKIHTNVWNA